MQLQHVEGHQDKKRPYQELDLFGQLNVDADQHHAGDYHLKFGACRPFFVVMSRLTRAHLLFSDGTVTGRYQQELLQEATTKPLLKYIGQKYSWTETTLQNIHWGAHAQPIKHTLVPHTHMVKLLHQLLPTHAQANTFFMCPARPSATHNDISTPKRIIASESSSMV